MINPTESPREPALGSGASPLTQAQALFAYHQSQKRLKSKAGKVSVKTTWRWTGVQDNYKQRAGLQLETHQKPPVVILIGEQEG